MIQIEGGHTASAYLDAFWQWVTFMADGDYDAALDALYWEDIQYKPDPSRFRHSIEHFFGGPDPWSVVVPNERLIDEINRRAEIHLPTGDEPGVFVTHIPVTTRPEDPKDDKIPLMGHGVEMLVRDVGGLNLLAFGIFMRRAGQRVRPAHNPASPRSAGRGISCCLTYPALWDREVPIQPRRGTGESNGASASTLRG